MSAKLKKIDFISIFLRSLFIQAVWNFKGMVSVGVCYALIPVGKRLFKDRAEYQFFLKRHLNFFNTHPYFSSYAIGAIAKIEEELYLNSEGESEKLERFKNALIGPLGSVGDQLFWATIKPAAIIAGFAGIIVSPTLQLKLLFLIIFFILYNIPHLYTRINGLRQGYRNGFQVYKLLTIENFAKIKNFYQRLGAIATGLFVSYLVFHSIRGDSFKSLVFIFSLLLAFYFQTYKRVTYLPIIVSLFLAVVIGAYILIL